MVEKGNIVGRPAKLVRGEQSAVGESGSLVLERHDASDPRLESLAYLVQEGFQGAVVGSLRTAGPRGVDLEQLAEVVLDGRPIAGVVALNRLRASQQPGN